MTYITDGPIRADIHRLEVTQELAGLILGSFEVMTETLGDIRMSSETNLTIVHERNKKPEPGESENFIIHGCNITSHESLPDMSGTKHEFVASSLEPYLYDSLRRSILAYADVIFSS